MEGREVITQECKSAISPDDQALGTTLLYDAVFQPSGSSILNCVRLGDVTGNTKTLDSFGRGMVGSDRGLSSSKGMQNGLFLGISGTGHVVNAGRLPVGHRIAFFDRVGNNMGVVHRIPFSSKSGDGSVKEQSFLFNLATSGDQPRIGNKWHNVHGLRNSVSESISKCGQSSPSAGSNSPSFSIPGPILPANTQLLPSQQQEQQRDMSVIGSNPSMSVIDNRNPFCEHSFTSLCNASTANTSEAEKKAIAPADHGTTGSMVCRRKALFESGQNQNNIPSTSKRRNTHKTEIERLTSLSKFASVASRMASFEKSSDEDVDGLSGKEHTSHFHNPATALKHSAKHIVDMSPNRHNVSSIQAVNSTHHKSAFPHQENSLSCFTAQLHGDVFYPPKLVAFPSVEFDPSSRDESQKNNESLASCIQCTTMHSSQPVQIVQPIKRELPGPTKPYHSYSRQHRSFSIPKCLINNREMDMHCEYDAYNDHLAALHCCEEDDDDDSGGRLLRQSSYMSAVNALPTHVIGNVAGFLHHDALSTSVPAKADCMPPPPDVVLRRRKDSANTSIPMLHRRTSYLMATSRERSSNECTPEKKFTSDFQNSSSENAFTRPYITEEPMLSPGREKHSLNKLKNFFGEQTPCILEARHSSREKRLNRPGNGESLMSDITCEGTLWCKTSVSDSKRCSDRSWKQIWAVLRGHDLFFIKDLRDEDIPCPIRFNEPPIDIRLCSVDIAHDYSWKRKHVFRLTTSCGSVHLLQADDKGTMMSWVQAIRTNSHPSDDDEHSTGMVGFSCQNVCMESISPTGISRVEGIKDNDRAKKGTTMTIKKLSQSPNIKRKKTDSGGSKKGGWKDRIMARSFKKQTAVSLQLSSHAAMFGVPLEDCIPSPSNEYVPLIVELCTRIVEARGVDSVGVYRVPGNSVALSRMQEELNRGIESVNMDNDRWLDVNVVSSLLKAFFRKLPQPLVTPELYTYFIEANRHEKVEKRMLKLKRLLHTLPEHHYETFKYLAAHLSVVANNGCTNKMDAKNLAIMFGPTLIRKIDDDDAVSMVTDMSDQCRIVESVILHDKWFFSNWTSDHYVPVDPGIRCQPSIAEGHIVQADYEDADSVINTKHIITSIVNAANKKLKLRQQSKSAESLNCDRSFGDSSCAVGPPAVRSFSVSDTVECGVYRERNVDKAIARAAASSMSQGSLVSSLSVSDDHLDGGSCAPLATSEPDFSEFEDRLCANSAKCAVRAPDDWFAEQSKEVASGWVGRDTLDWLKRLEEEARMIRHMEEQRRWDIGRRMQRQQHAKQELHRSQHHLDSKSERSVDDLSASSILHTHPSLSSCQSYSQNEARIGKQLCCLPPVFQSAVAERRADEQCALRCMCNNLDNVCVESCDVHPKSVDCIRVLPSSRSLSQCSLTGSSQNSLDPSKYISSGLDSFVGSHVQRGGNQHHGSLDSMLDLIELNGGAPGVSSDSEDGSDLLTSLTTTFDQKLKILLNPKYRLTSRHQPPGQVLPAHVNRYSVVHAGDSEGSHNEIMEQQDYPIRKSGFQDPSLHRASKVETKVGVASRFERPAALLLNFGDLSCIPVLCGMESRHGSRFSDLLQKRISPSVETSIGNSHFQLQHFSSKGRRFSLYSKTDNSKPSHEHSPALSFAQFGFPPRESVSAGCHKEIPLHSANRLLTMQDQRQAPIDEMLLGTLKNKIMNISTGELKSKGNYVAGGFINNLQSSVPYFSGVRSDTNDDNRGFRRSRRVRRRIRRHTVAVSPDTEHLKVFSAAQGGSACYCHPLAASAWHHASLGDLNCDVDMQALFCRP